MSIYFIHWMENFLATCILFLFSSFGINVDEKIFNIINQENTVDSTIVTTINEHEVITRYNKKLPSNITNVIVEGVDGVSYIDTDGTVKVLKQRVDEIVEVGTGKYGEYNGITTGYGGDCPGCSGTVACKTREGKYMNLFKDGVYYNDQQFGKVRIVAADHKLFNCGTIIEVDNGKQDPFLAIVLDTGIDMRRAWRNQGIAHLDIAFVTQKDPEVYSVTTKNNGAKFSVQRWGW